ncbi:DUF3693 domain-containing protein [Alkalimonas mucilaginosa]|uniref:DUF3693 domain-containing protein n=1 Tax=Alkalimonas mucilaginosa TaxID=3057676 RepID=A0ABU7JF11_9GAMM|nr:DUF3693 domain-containing protein [Alkalimonas sp. MEB004]MEE2023603.1 DUF3693 domain-containing protein [Alkalimonas sp. MEB004]
MSFSYELIGELKKSAGLSTDKEASEVIPKMTPGALGDIKKGKRHLTEEQALFIAHECELNTEWVLVHLAEETAKSEEAKQVWHKFGKKLNKSVTAAILALFVVFGGFGLNQGLEPDFT